LRSTGRLGNADNTTFNSQFFVYWYITSRYASVIDGKMVEFRIRIHPEQRLTRIPKILTQTFGSTWCLQPNTKAAIIYPEGVDLETVRRSVELILKDLEFRTKRSARKNLDILSARPTKGAGE